MKRTTISLFPALPHDKCGSERSGPNVVTVMSKDLTDIPGKEGLMITVEYCPSSAYPVASLSPFGEGGRRKIPPISRSLLALRYSTRYHGASRGYP